MKGEAKTEAQRRARVMRGWSFRKWTAEEKAAIIAYLRESGPAPAGYETLDRTVR